MKNEGKMNIREQIEAVKAGIIKAQRELKEKQSEIDKKQSLLDKEKLRKYYAWLCTGVILLGACYIAKKTNNQKDELETSLSVQLENANSRIEYLIDTYERYNATDIWIMTTNYNDGRVRNTLITYDRYYLPAETCIHLGKAIFSDYPILQGFDYYGEETLLYSVSNGKLCGNYVHLVSHNGGKTEVIGDYKQISLNEDTLIRQVIKDGNKEMSSLKKDNGIKDIKQEKLTNLLVNERIKGKTYTRDELIEIENELNENSKVLALSKN